MQLIKATEADYELMNELLLLGNHDYEMGYAFPRGDLEDVKNEFSQYESHVCDSFFLIKDETNVLGIVGYLKTSEIRAALIGPVMYKMFYTYDNVKTSVEMLLNQLRFNFERISADILKENIVLKEVLELNHFQFVYSSITMRTRLNSSLIKNDHCFSEIQLIGANDKEHLAAINQLFKDTLADWANETIVSLYEYFGEEYEMAAVIQQNQVVGAILWIWFDELNFGRIEYLAIQRSYQGQGYGGILLDYAMSYLSKKIKPDFTNYFYLDFDVQNKNAQKLYVKKGFELEYQDSIYRLDLK